MVSLCLALVRKAGIKFAIEYVGEARRRLTYIVIRGDQGSKVDMKVCVCLLSFSISLIMSESNTYASDLI